MSFYRVLRGSIAVYNIDGILPLKWHLALSIVLLSVYLESLLILILTVLHSYAARTRAS